MLDMMPLPPNLTAKPSGPDRDDDVADRLHHDVRPFIVDHVPWNLGDHHSPARRESGQVPLESAPRLFVASHLLIVDPQLGRERRWRDAVSDHD
jgi:hypothetical protein